MYFAGRSSGISAKNYELYHATKYKKGERYGIPYRILVPVKLKNALVAGRCVSTDREMNSAIRLMPTCFSMGDAAGTAAAAKLAEVNCLSYNDVRIPDGCIRATIAGVEAGKIWAEGAGITEDAAKLLTGLHGNIDYIFALKAE